MSQEQLVSTPTEPSLRTMGPPTGPNTSNKKALMVTGVTMLAIVLVASQAFTAYTVYKHSEKLSMLQTRSERLQEITHRAMTANRTPMKMEKPMSSFPLLISDFVDEKDKTTPPPKEVPMTKCQKEAALLEQTSQISFHLRCDDQGAYIPEQCWQEANLCWCVDNNGTKLPDTMAEGHAQCSTDLVADK